MAKGKGWIGWVALGLLGALIATQRDGDRVVSVGLEGAPTSGADAPPTEPTRILPGSAAASDWMAALGVDPRRVVALPEHADDYSSLIRRAPGRWSAVPRYARLTSEVALGFEPDLVLVSSISDAGAVARIRASEARVLTVGEPATFDELIGEGQRLAEAVGQDGAGAQLAADLESRRRALDARDARVVSVLPYGNFGGGGTTSGSGTNLDLVLELAGYRNAAADAGIEGFANLTFERVLTLEFDAVLVLGEEGDGQEGAAGSQSALALRNAQSLGGLDAIREKRFMALSAALYSSNSPTIMDAAEEIARQGDALFP